MIATLWFPLLVVAIITQLVWQYSEPRGWICISYICTTAWSETTVVVRDRVILFAVH